MTHDVKPFLRIAPVVLLAPLALPRFLDVDVDVDADLDLEFELALAAAAAFFGFVR